MMTPLVNIMPKAALRGSRNYVHSTDLYEGISEAVAAAGLAFDGPVDFRIRSKIVTRPRFAIVSGESSAKDCAASCAFSSMDRSYLVLIEASDQPVTARKPYDEGPAAAFSTVEGQKASLTGPTGLRPVEAVTALAVLLHKRALPPPPGQRWMLGQMTMRRALAETETATLALEIDRRLGSTMTRTRIDAADGVLGSMIFILAAG